MRLHDDAMDGDEQISLELATSHYCMPYRLNGEPCVIGDSTSQFRLIFEYCVCYMWSGIPNPLISQNTHC